MKICFVLLGCMLLVGCTKSSGVMEYASDLYAISVDVDSEFYGPGTAQKQAFDGASEFCQKQNNVVEVQSVKSDNSSFGYNNASMVFRCL